MYACDFFYRTRVSTEYTACTVLTDIGVKPKIFFILIKQKFKATHRCWITVEANGSRFLFDIDVIWFSSTDINVKFSIFWRESLGNFVNAFRLRPLRKEITNRIYLQNKFKSYPDLDTCGFEGTRCLGSIELVHGKRLKPFVVKLKCLERYLKKK